MDMNLIVGIGRELITTGILLVLPTILVSMGVGLIISIFQAVTSIQEQTLTFRRASWLWARCCCSPCLGRCRCWRTSRCG